MSVGNAGPRRPVWLRWFAGCAVLLTAWHVFASFLWIAPPSPLREVVPGSTLSSYMLPLFGQSWSVFAPDPINGDYRFEVRAQMEQGVAETQTEWVDATDVELSMIRYTLATPRAGILSSELASRYQSAYFELSQRQKDEVAGSFVGEGWEKRLLSTLGSDTAGPPDAASPTGAATDAYLREERRATAYATQVARAVWGDGVTAVTFRVTRQNVVQFAERHNPDATRPEPTVTAPGARGQVIEPGQRDENFARTFRAQYERLAQ